MYLEVITQITQRVEVCVYIKKENTAIKQRIDLQPLSGCIVTKIRCNKKKVYFIVLHRSPSQTVQHFYDFLDAVETMISKLKSLKPQFFVNTGDFNCRLSKWWADDNESSEVKVLNDNDLFEFVQTT